MSLGAGLAIAGAFIGTSLAFMFSPGLDVSIFIAPLVASVFVSFK